MRVVLASSNRGKLAELGALLAPFGYELVSQAELGIETPPETGATFADNALLKARHAARLANLPAIADDSGLAVDALGGAPGLYSARYAGEGATDEANNRKLLTALTGVEPALRTARYHCVIAFVRDAEDATPVFGSGSWEGRIALMARGTGGFGYDPLFEVAPDFTQTAAEMPPGTKNRVSHRALALESLITQLRSESRPNR